ncbi:MAG: sigma-54-dependent Fis family transcriptional regulator, partial [Deltaproteobacteria bacterium]
MAPEGPEILIVDDQRAVRTALAILFELHGLRSIEAESAEEALARVAEGRVGLVVQDMNFTQGTTSGAEGVSLFRALRERDPSLPVILLTAWGDVSTAVMLVKEGAADYLTKPWDDDKLVTTARNLLRLRATEAENAALRERAARRRRELAARYDLRGLIYASEAMGDLVATALKIAPADVPVLITGPNGSGKEKVAELIQANSRRAAGPYVTLNAGAIPESLVEAELFGAEAGAFTGAHKLRIGRFEAAHGGTLFLDEIGNLSLAGQVKLLRVLQSGTFERVGSSHTRRADVRIISATNADLTAAMAAGTFREDLYFRLNVIELAIPPLAERRADILPLAESFLAAGGGSPTGGLVRFDDAAQRALVAHDWPGNVRELQNRVQRGQLMCRGDVVTAADLGLTPSDEAPLARPAAPPRPVAAP